jgi:transcription termination factor Rho
LTPLFPEEKLHLSTKPEMMSRCIGFAQLEGTGEWCSFSLKLKTVLLKEIANAITKSPVYLLILLIDERPEEYAGHATEAFVRK